MASLDDLAIAVYCFVSCNESPHLRVFASAISESSDVLLDVEQAEAMSLYLFQIAEMRTYV